MEPGTPATESSLWIPELRGSSIQTSLMKNRNVPHHSSSAPGTRPPRRSLKPSEQKESDRIASPRVRALVLAPLVIARWQLGPVAGVNRSNTTWRELPGNISPRVRLALAYPVLSGRLRQPGIIRRTQILESDRPWCGPWLGHLDLFPQQEAVDTTRRGEMLCRSSSKVLGSGA